MNADRKVRTQFACASGSTLACRGWRQFTEPLASARALRGEALVIAAVPGRIELAQSDAWVSIAGRLVAMLG